MPARLAVLLLRCYKRFISPMLGDHCRYIPSCSEYAMEAYSRFGFMKGTRLTAARLLRCAPWGGCGYDPVPSDTDTTFPPPTPPGEAGF